MKLVVEKGICDLICDLITGIDSVLNTVRIICLEAGVFFAQLEIKSNKLGKRNIDARPSDAIAIALRMNTPILVASKILDDAGVLEDSLEQQEEKPKEKRTELSIQSLKDKMQIAIDDEEYEIAARLRDKISELES